MSRPKRVLLFSTIFVVAIGSVFGAIQFRRSSRLQRDVKKAEEEIPHGFWALAFENLDHHRHQLVKNENDCNTLLNVYANAKKADRLEWASQACVENGVETLATYLSLVTAEEFQGRDQDALGLLNQLTKKFDRESEPYRRMAILLARNKDEAGTAEAIFNAAMRTGDPTVSLQAIQMLLSQKRIADALKVAVKVRIAKIDNPEAQLLIARALILGNDGTMGNAQIAQARELMAKMDPQAVKRLEHDYADVFSKEVRTSREE